jgi:hypothetical protein
VTLHLIARWSVEHANEKDPAPHLFTTYWTLEEATGKSERTLRRHLVEGGHPWSRTVRRLIDLRVNYGEMLAGKDEHGNDLTRPTPVGIVIRFFSRTRLSPKARVKMWGRRDLLADSDEGKTRPSRPQWIQDEREQRRHRRRNPLMSGYRSVKEQTAGYQWLLVKLGQMVTDRQENLKDPGSLYADIPRNYLLDALRHDLALAVERARERGASVKRARSVWVDTAAKMLAERFNEHRPQSRLESDRHVTRWDGFTDLWRRHLWTNDGNDSRKIRHFVRMCVQDGM